MINRRAAGLIDENPLMVYRSLAKEIGLNEAIILQQVHFWSRDSANVRDGYSWVYNTYADWEKQFDFWSTATIRRSINRLEEAGLLISTSEYNKMKIDNTKWYRIDYELLEKRMSRPPDQIEQTECSECTDTPDQIEQANNQREPERTPKRTNKDIVPQAEHQDSFDLEIVPVVDKKKKLIGEVVDYLNQKAGKGYSPQTKETVKLIGGRIEAGATWEQFKHVIEVKVLEWLNDASMKTYLAPKTLFNESNFEKYKQQTFEETIAKLEAKGKKPAFQNKTQQTHSDIDDLANLYMKEVNQGGRNDNQGSNGRVVVDDQNRLPEFR